MAGWPTRRRSIRCGAWCTFGHPERWRGTIISDDPKEDAEYVAALVVTDLVTEWEVRGTGRGHVRVIVWEDEEGDGPEDAAFIVEIQLDIDIGAE
ncbi:hypothetical protein [Streptomyces blattellae]|uniref:hypothetical protein n=1 Tax=Streptomyces blattellae TaxID=2569855 RepID=UPI0012B8D80C|nr:hypothetical protein [Streptomyces blattellae]